MRIIFFFIIRISIFAWTIYIFKNQLFLFKSQKRLVLLTNYIGISKEHLVNLNCSLVTWPIVLAYKTIYIIDWTQPTFLLFYPNSLFHQSNVLVILVIFSVNLQMNIAIIKKYIFGLTLLIYNETIKFIVYKIYIFMYANVLLYISKYLAITEKFTIVFVTVLFL